jgi:hypothetical protein
MASQLTSPQLLKCLFSVREYLRLYWPIEIVFIVYHTHLSCMNPIHTLLSYVAIISSQARIGS